MAPTSELEDSPEVLSLLLEMRAELAAARARILSRLVRLDQRVARMERSRASAPELSAVRSVGSSIGRVAPPARRIVHVRARPIKLDDLSADLLALVAAALHADDELAAALSCRKLRAAVGPRGLFEKRLGGRTTDASASSSHARLVWSISCGLPLSPRLCALAAGCGQLPQLSWLQAQGCLWDYKTCEEAAGGGHLAVLRWAHANGCPWNEETC